MKYKVGDRVRIVKEWNEKTNQNHDGKMDKWLGKVMTIRKIDGYFYHMEEDIHDRYNIGWSWNEACIEGLAHECNQKIVITSDGVETLARLYDGNKVVKSASAKCNPEDEFDFNVGAKIAYERLMGEEKPKVEEKPVEKPKYEVGQYYQHNGMCGKGIFKVTKIEGKTVHYEIVEGIEKDTPDKDFDLGSRFDKDSTPVPWNVVNRPVKKGDYVRIVRPSFGFNEVGDILKVHEPHGTGILVLNKHHPRYTCDHCGDDFDWCYCKQHFEVVEPLGEKKPEPKTETKPTFKEGDRVRHSEYGDGTVICLAEFGGYGVEFEKEDFLSHNCTPQKLVWGRCGTKGTCHWCKPDEITLITEKSKESKKPKKTEKQKYNGKVVCVESAHKFWTVGKVYEFKDGIITDDDGDRRGVVCHFGCFEDWDEFCKNGRDMKFIEVVE